VTWRWVAERVKRAERLERQFHTQGEAETWLGEFYPDLLDDGVREVSLYEGDRRVYGPMSLEAEA
jgi:hypothetical protein